MSAAVCLRPCTRESWHAFWRGYVNDPMMDQTPYAYDREKCDRAFDLRMQDTSRQYFLIYAGPEAVGDIYLKHIDRAAKSACFGIALQCDAVKGKGYGSAAIEQLISYAFETLDLEVLLADTVLRNLRSQHVLEKLGFVHLRDDDVFRYYERRRRRAAEGGTHVPVCIL